MSALSQRKRNHLDSKTCGSFSVCLESVKPKQSLLKIYVSQNDDQILQDLVGIKSLQSTQFCRKQSPVVCNGNLHSPKRPEPRNNDRIAEAITFSDSKLSETFLGT